MRNFYCVRLSKHIQLLVHFLNAFLRRRKKNRTSRRNCFSDKDGTQKMGNECNSTTTTKLFHKPALIVIEKKKKKKNKTLSEESLKFQRSYRRFNTSVKRNTYIFRRFLSQMFKNMWNSIYLIIREIFIALNFTIHAFNHFVWILHNLTYKIRLIRRSKSFDLLFLLHIQIVSRPKQTKKRIV